MRNSLLLILALCLSFSVFGQQKIQLRSADKVECTKSDMTGLRASFSFSSLDASNIETTRGEHSAIHIEGAYPTGNVGEPQLPMLTRLIAIPTGATPIVTMDAHSETEYNLSDYGIGTIAAMQAPVRKDVNPDTVKYVFNEAAYARNSYNDDPIASVEVLGTMRGITLGRLVVQPVRYNPAAGTVKVFNDIEVSVDFQNGDAESTKQMFSNTFNPAFNSVYDKIFNIDMLTRGGSTDYTDLYNTPVKTLVICYSGFKNNEALHDWLQWKLQKGYYVDIHYTDEMGTSSSAIASFIKTKYDASVSAGNAYTYLIVIGDTGQVPQYMTKSIDYPCASDLGYASVNFSENTSNYFPDMYYSRISVENDSQLTNYMNKVLTYEKCEFSDGGDYLNNVILVGGYDLWWSIFVAKPTINYASQYYFNSNNTTYGGFGNGYLHITADTENAEGYSGTDHGVYNGINDGVCFLNYTAHGDRQEWYNPKLTAAQAATLTNTGKYFFAVGNCCLSGNFNNTSTDYSPGSEIGDDACLAETMIRVPNAGAIASIGSSPYSYWYEDFYWAVGAHAYSDWTDPTQSTSSNGVYDVMFNDSYWNSASSLLYVGNLAVQEAVTNGYANSGVTSGDCHNSAHYYFQFYHAFGDGSVMPYITKPEANTVTIPNEIPLGTTLITVNAAAGSYVAVTDNNSVIYGVGEANSNGVATVTFTEPITEACTVHVVVTRQQYQPYFGTITVTDGCVNPINLDAQSITTNAATLTWTAFGSSSVSLRYRKSGEEEWTEIENVTSPYVLQGLTKETAYEAQVIAECEFQWSPTLYFATDCDDKTMPYTYGFEEDSPLVCWTTVSGNRTITTSSEAYTGEHYLRLQNSDNNIIALPKFTEPTNNLRLIFYTRPEDYSRFECGNLAVGYITDLADANSFVALETYAYDDWTSNEYQEKTVDFNVEGVPVDAYIAMRHYNCNSLWSWYIDDVTVEVLPSCLEPINLAANNLTPNSTELSWTAKNGETAWTVYYKKTADEVYTTSVQVDANPYILTGLEAATSYDFYVVAHCSETDQSPYSKVLSFVTFTGPYTIGSINDWNQFCTDLGNDVNNHFQNTYVKMTADIGTQAEPVTRIAGALYHDFMGTFEGDGHTLYVSYGSQSNPVTEEYTAPFGYTNSTATSVATFKNLTVDGTIYTNKPYASGLVGKMYNEAIIQNCTSNVTIHTTGLYAAGFVGNCYHASSDVIIEDCVSNAIIYTSQKHAGGFIGCCEDNANIVNCLSNATINSSVRGDGSHGGFIGLVGSSNTYTVNMTGCAFTGQLLGADTHSWGGFIGWKTSSMKVNITNSLFKPSSQLSSVNNDNCSNFVRYNSGDLNITNTYYIMGFNEDQGKPSFTLSLEAQPATYGSVSFAGESTNYDKSGITAYTTGLQFNNIMYANTGDVIRIVATPNTGFDFHHWNDDSTSNPYDYTMSKSTTLTAHFSYVISTTEQWNAFCNEVNNGNSYEDIIVSLTNDIGPVSAMAGTSEYPFKGTFEGNGHTLTLDMTATDANFTAPFRYISGATIQNLKVTGTITTNYKFCAGLAGDCNGYYPNSFINCVSDVTINSTVDGDGTHGGFMARVQYGYAGFAGCAFTGKLLGNNKTHSWGGFVGWTDRNNSGESIFLDCVFAPSEINIKNDDTNDNSKTFSRGYPDDTQASGVRGVTVVNSFYDPEVNLDTDQGNAFQYTIAGDTDVSVALAGQTMDYDLSGIIGYATSQDYADVIKYGNTIYTKAGNTVGLNLDYTGSVGSVGFVIAENSFGTLSGKSNPYTLIMGEGNTVITAFENNCPMPESLSVDDITPHTATISWEGGAENGCIVQYTKSTTFDFDDCSLQGWTLIDANNDGDNWKYYCGDDDYPGHNDSYGFVGSKSFSNFGSLTPDNYLVSPKVQLGGTMSFWAESCLNYDYEEHFSVLVSTNSNTNTDDFTQIQEWTLPDGKIWHQYTVDLSAYSGEEGYVAIRHFGCTDKYYLFVDDITITDPLGGTTLTVEVNGNSLTVEGLEPETEYSVFVSNKCSSAFHSNWAEARFATPSACAVPANIASSINSSSVDLSWNDYQDNYLIQYRPVYALDDVKFSESFEKNVDGWTTVDRNGDGFNWEHVLNDGYEIHSGAGCFTSASYSNENGALTPDNWLISPQLTIGENEILSVWAAGQDKNYAAEIFRIYVSTAGTNVGSGESTGDFVAATSVDFVATPNYIEHMVDLSEYAGQQVYIAIRHYNVTDQFRLNIDDFVIRTASDFYPWTDVETDDNNLILHLGQLYPNTVYDWRVQGLNCDGQGTGTEFSETANFTTPDFSTFTKDIAPYTADGGWYLITSPIGMVSPKDVSNMLSNSYDLYSFDQSEDLEWRNHKTSPFDLEVGKGYLYANGGDGENDVTILTFAGLPYTDGTVTLSKVDNVHFSGWNLIGNPLSTAATINKPFYRMNEDGSALSAQVETGNQVAAMEGVFVQATQNGETATFTPVTRSNGNETAGMLTIGVTQVVEPVETPANRGNGPSTGSGTLTAATLDRAIVRFDGGQTLGKFTLSPDDNKLYIQQEGEDYAVVNAGKAGELPLNFKATKNGNYTMSVGCEAVSFSYLHLIDNMTGADVDLLANPSYSFDAKRTDYESRFKLVFATNNGPSTGSGTFAFYNGNEWVITEEHAGATVQIIDVMGRIVYSRDGVHTVSTNQMAPGVYVMRLINGNDVKTQKIVVN